MVALNDRVIYRCRPGQIRGGQSDLAAVVTRVNRGTDGNPDGTVELLVLPSDGEPIRQNKVPERAEGLPGNYWAWPDATIVAGAQSRMQTDMKIAHLEKEVADLRQMVEDLTAPSAKGKKAG